MSDTPNADARRDALVDPAGTVRKLAASPWIAERLDLWPDPNPREGQSVPNGDTAWHAAQARRLLQIVTGTPDDELLDAGARQVLERYRTAMARHAIKVLGTIPEKPGSQTGLSLLAAYWKRRPPTAKPYPLTHRASLPDFDREDAHLVGGVPDAFEQPEPQLSLPGFEADTGPLSHWLLHWFAATGGPISQGGRLPLELSLMVGGIAHLAIRDRDGGWKTLGLPHRIEHEERFIDPKTEKPVASIERWLWPDGWGGNRRARWRMIPDALNRLRRGWAGWLAIPGIGSVAILTPSVVPGSRDAPLVELTVRIPKSAAHGSRFDWPRFQRYAVESATLARGYLAAVDYMGRSARDGHPITRQIAAPILDANGEPIRRKGGKIVRSKTELVPNPQARFVRALTDTQLARMIGHSDKAARDRRKRHRAREVFERLNGDGVIEFAPVGKRFRIFGPKT